MNTDDDSAQIALDALLGRMRGNQVQTVVHQGLGAWGPSAIVACFATILGLVIVTLIMVHENDKLSRRVETLEAWQGVNNNTISKIQATIEYLNGSKK